MRMPTRLIEGQKNACLTCVSQDQMDVGALERKSIDFSPTLHHDLGAGSLPLEVKREPYFWVSKGHNLSMF